MKTSAANIDQALLSSLSRIEPLIGGTPLLQISRLWANPTVKIYAKLEWMQLSGSVKARAAFEIIRTAIIEGKLTSKQTLIDASSGNTGIAYAAIGSAIGLDVHIFIPENASIERKRKLSSLGAQLTYTSPLEGTDGAQQQAHREYLAQQDRYFYADQYSNEANWRAHYAGSANEIYQQSDGQITHFVAGLGTTGTFTGTSKRLKELRPEIVAVALQPDSAMHALEGWKHLETAKVSGIFKPEYIDKTLLVNSDHAVSIAKSAGTAEGVLISPSAGANLAGAIQLAEQLESGYIVTVFPDSAEKYQEFFNN